MNLSLSLARQVSVWQRSSRPFLPRSTRPARTWLHTDRLNFFSSAGQLLASFSLALTFAFAPARAQSTANPDSGTLTHGPSSGSVIFSFWGASGRTYLVEHTTDLTRPWTYFPIIEPGTDAPVSFGFLTGGAPGFFLRLRYTDQTYSGDPYAADFDADGLSNGWELTYGLDPFSNDSVDDADGDGFTNLAEYQAGVSPLFRDANELGLEVYTP